MNVFNFEFDKVGLKGLIEFAEARALTRDISKEYAITLMFEDENIVSRVLEESGRIGESLSAKLLEDIEYIWKRIEAFDYLPTKKRTLRLADYQRSVECAVAADSPKKLLNALVAHYSTFGAGKTAKYIAFKWHTFFSNDASEYNGLVGIENPDDIRLDDLFCLDEQKRQLLDNTNAFLNGLPSNNALLYGDSGSGKSSIVKAILNALYPRGLRLVEMPKAYAKELPAVYNFLREKRNKYIVFMDDLSFEQGDTEYKDLKVALEGQIERQPSNVLIYATSNRRHLVSEKWADRQGEDVHVRDTKNERLSLSERFGLNVYFSAPDQAEYLKIVQGLLAQKNIELTDQIINRALQWELAHGGRSGRAAAQFIRSI